MNSYVRQRNVRRSPLASGTPNDPTLSRKHRPDYVLALIAVSLLALGFVVVYAISPGIAAARGVSEQYLVSKQLIAIGLGIVSFLVMATLPFTLWRKLLWVLVSLSVILTIIALLTPVNAQYPAHRWIRFSGLSFQTAEFVKLTLLIWAAAFFAQRTARAELHDSHKTLRPTLYVIGAVGIVLAGLQSDLGSAAVMVAIVLIMAYVVGMPLKQFIPLGAIVAAFVVLILAASFVVPTLRYRVDRFSTFLNPTSDCQDAGYQSCQALIAVGSGGVAGKGLGKSVQATGYLPEAANDSIFAIMAEKFGFIGMAIIIGVYVALFARLKRIIMYAPSMYSRLLVVGVLAWFSTQAIINIGAMIGLLPLKGITLPFVSYGGTSLLFVTAALGLVFQISKYTTYKNKIDESVEAGHDEHAMRRARPLIVRRAR